MDLARRVLEACCKTVCQFCKDASSLDYVDAAELRKCYNWGFMWVHRVQGTDGAWFYTPCQASKARQAGLEVINNETV